MVELLASRGSAAPAAVVGLGAVTAFGWSVESLAAGLSSGRCAVGKPERFKTKGHRTELASEVPPLDQAPTGLSARTDWSRLSSADRFAVSASLQAWRQGFGEGDAAQEPPVPSSVGVFFGGSTAGMAEAEAFFARTLGERSERPRLRDLVSQQLNGPGDAVARELGICGPVVSFSSACASGALALGAALDALRTGEVEVAIAGGSDSLCQMTYAGFNSLRAVDPESSRPFRADRAGLNLGEGAGAVLLVNDHWARVLTQRGQSVMAWLAGGGASCDAHHMTAPHPQGEGAAGAMRAALQDAGCTAEEVGFVNTHGTGTPHNDAAEAAAIRSVLKARSAKVPITSIKGAIGHLLGAAGAVEAVATVLAILAGAVQPTAGRQTLPGAAQMDEADPEFGVDLVLGEERRLATEALVALSNSFAFGGANAALLFYSQIFHSALFPSGGATFPSVGDDLG